MFLIYKREPTGLKHFNDSKPFIGYSNDKDDISENIEEYYPHKKRETLIVYHMIADMLRNKKPNLIVTELIIRDIKLNISLVFFAQSYLAVLKKIRLNFMHYFITKIPNNWELQQIAFNQSSDIDFRDITNWYKKCNAKSYSLLVIYWCYSCIR